MKRTGPLSPEEVSTASQVPRLDVAGRPFVWEFVTGLLARARRRP